MNHNQVLLNTILLLLNVSFLEAGSQEQLLSRDELVKKIGIEESFDDPTDKRVITNDLLLREIYQQLHLKNITRIALYIGNAPISIDQKIELLQLILKDNPYGFTYDQAMKLILAVTNTYETKAEQEKILNLSLDFPDLLEKGYPFFIAAHNGYINILSSLLDWSLQRQAENLGKKSIMDTLIYRSLVRAVHDDDPKALELIYELVSPEYKKFLNNKLLWYVAHEGRGTSTIEKLKSLGANVDAPYKKTTPLIEAIRQGHKEVVEALINAGADVNAMHDLEIGSPLQQAIESRNLDIEDMLRKGGAHE